MLMAKPVREMFPMELIGEEMPPEEIMKSDLPIERRAPGYGRPRLPQAPQPVPVVKLWRPFTLEKETVHFTVTIENCSQVVTSKMIQAEAIDPSGNQSGVCLLTKSLVERNVYNGMFFVGDRIEYSIDQQFEHFEGGTYHLRVSLRTDVNQDFGTTENNFETTVPVPIYHDYVAASDAYPGPALYRLEFENTSTAEQGATWGLAYNCEKAWVFYSDLYGKSVNAIDAVCCGDDYSGILKVCGYKKKTGEPFSSSPFGICCDVQNKRVLVCDQSEHQITVFSQDNATQIQCFGETPGGAILPRDVAISPGSDYIAVSDIGMKRVLLYDKVGNFIQETAPGLFSEPRAVTFGQYNNKLQVYVGDATAKVIKRLPVNSDWSELDPTGVTLNKETNPAPCVLGCPEGLTEDSAGNIVVADSTNDSVAIIEGRSGNSLQRVFSFAENWIRKPVNIVGMWSGTMACLESDGKLTVF